MQDFFGLWSLMAVMKQLPLSTMLSNITAKNRDDYRGAITQYSELCATISHINPSFDKIIICLTKYLLQVSP